MIGWMVRNLISSRQMLFQKYIDIIRLYKGYCIQTYPFVSRHGYWSVLSRLKGIRRRVKKLIKTVKDYSCWEKLTT